MKKIKLKKWLYIVGLLCMSVSCKKDPPPPDYSCDDGTCCGQGKSKYKFIKVIENAPADYAAATFYPAVNLKDPVITYADNANLISICGLNNIQSILN
jgi:hypothetical protein